MNHRDTETRFKKQGIKKSSSFPLCLRAFAVISVLFPSMALACPRCVDATPYKTGMQLAVAFLLPIPFVLATALFFWIRRASKSETE